MNYYITAVLTAKSRINDICYLVLICNSNQEEKCGIRKVITPNFPYYKYIVDSLMAQGKNVEWRNACRNYTLSHPICIGEGNIEMVKIPQLDTLKNNTMQLLDYNNVLSLSINGSFDRSWENDFLENYSLEAYSLSLFGNFTYGDLFYNIKAINSSLQQIELDFDKKYNNYISAPLYKQSRYPIEAKRDENGHYFIVYPEIAVKTKIDCDYIEELKWGLSIVHKDGLKGIIDIGGNYIIPCIYEEVLPLKLFKRDENTCEEIEIRDYDRYSENLIYTFIQNQEGMWAHVTISTYDNCHWHADYFVFEYEKLFFGEDKNYVIALFDREYADPTDSVPLEYYGENFDFLYRLTIVYYKGGHNVFRQAAIDDIICIFNNRYIVAKKNTFNEPKIGLIEIEENRYFYPYIDFRQVLRMSDDFKAIEYIGSSIITITFNNYFDIQKYYKEIDLFFYNDTLDESYEYMVLYHLKDGFIEPPILPNNYIYMEIKNKYLPLFSYKEYENESVTWYYYEEESQSWERWSEDEDVIDCYDD